MKRAVFFLSLFIIQHSSFIIGDARAQFSGSVSLGGQATNNVQSLDTIAPDQILMPAFELNYDVHPSNVSTITLTGSYTPSFYNLNPGLSFQETSIGATGVFYLSHQDAIAAEAVSDGTGEEVKHSHASHFREMGDEEMNYPSFIPRPNPAPVHPAKSRQDSKDDSLVDLAVSALYTLSGELDSTEFSTKGISKSRISELEDLRDSVSDVISTIADLLDSVGYSESAAEVVVSELQNIRTPFMELISNANNSKVTISLFDQAIHFLQQAKPEVDYLPTAPTPSAPSGASTATKTLIHALEILPGTSEAKTVSAPNLTLVTSSTRLRTFGFADAAVREDAEDSDATTMAALLTIPVAYTNHRGVHYSPADSILFGGNFGGNPNDNRMFTFGGSVEGLTSTNFSLRGAYDFIESNFPYDSVYSNTENRFTVTPRLAIGTSTVLFGEAALGLKRYLTPLIVTVSPGIYDTTRAGKIVTLKKAVIDTAGSNFQQYSYGAGVAEFIGDRWVVGALMAFNYNPNLRAYITTAQLTTGPKGKAVRAAAQIADDEYTYNLGRYTLLSDARIFGDIDFGLDLSYEHRVYGSAVGPKGAVIDSGRTEKGTFLNASLSKLFSFDERWIGVFNGLMLEGKLEVDNVTSTESFYSYSQAAFTITTTLTF